LLVTQRIRLLHIPNVGLGESWTSKLASVRPGSFSDDDSFDIADAAELVCVFGGHDDRAGRSE
jgi:hypothetical protein